MARFIHPFDGRGKKDAELRKVAPHGVEGAAQRLPHLQKIQRSFGEHDVGRVRAFTGPRAATACRQMGAKAYATGDRVAFATSSPDLHTAAHEAAHVLQQRAGVQLLGGRRDKYEEHADAVADRVVRGLPAQGLLDKYASVRASATPTTQMSPCPVQRAVYIGNESYADSESLGTLVQELVASFSEKDISETALEDVVAHWNAANKMFVDWESMKTRLLKDIKTRSSKVKKTIAPDATDADEYEGATRFEVTSYTPGSSGSVEVELSGLGVLASGGGVGLSSSRYAIGASVKITAVGDKEAKRWDCGFIQTVESSVHRSFYRKDKEPYCVHVNYLSRKRDAMEGKAPPWYRETENVAFQQNKQTVQPGFWDGPGWVADWTFGEGKLDSTDGRDVFTTWLIARNSETGKIVYLHHENWDVSWYVPVAYGKTSQKKLTKKTTDGAKTHHRGHDKGKGGKMPILGGKVALGSYKVKNLPWRL